MPHTSTQLSFIYVPADRIKACHSLVPLLAAQGHAMVPGGVACKQARADSTAQMGTKGPALLTEVGVGALQRQSLAMAAACEAQHAQHERSTHAQQLSEGDAGAQQQHNPELDTEAALPPLKQTRQRPKSLLEGTATARQDSGPHAGLATSASPQRSKRARQTSIRLSDICNGAAEREAVRLAELAAAESKAAKLAKPEMVAAEQASEHVESPQGCSHPEVEAAAPTSFAACGQSKERVEQEDASSPADSPAPPAKKQKLVEAGGHAASRSAPSRPSTPAGFVLKVPPPPAQSSPSLVQEKAGCHSLHSNG